MKKLFILLLILIVLGLVAMVAVPVMFKQKLLQVAVNTLNDQLDTKVEVADLKLSVWKDFPQLNLELQDVVVRGTSPFEKDTLLSVSHLRTTTPLKTLFHPSDIEIGRLVVDGVRLKLLVNKAGEKNWEIRQLSENSVQSDVSETGTSNDIHLKLNEFTVQDAAFLYQDENSGIQLVLSGIFSSLAGEMYGEKSTIDIQALAQEFDLSYNKIRYISKTALSLNTKLASDFEAQTFSFNNGELQINQLPLQLNGWVQSVNDSLLFDLALQAANSRFKDLLALVPPVYEKYLKDISTEGTANITGTITGYYFEDSYPAIDFEAVVDDASLRYAEMPELIEKISAGIEIRKPQGIFDSTLVDIKNAHAEIGKNPVDFNLKISQPMSDPFFDGVLIGKVYLADLQRTLPLNSVTLAGEIDANLLASWHYSAITAEDYTKLKSDGVVWLHDFRYGSPKLTQEIIVPEGKLDFSPQQIDLRSFVMRIGQSDFNLSGKVLNYLNYFLKDGILSADLQLNSHFVNLNQLLLLQKKEEAAVAGTSAASATNPAGNDDEKIAAFDIPERINLNFRSKIDRALLMRIPIENVSGVIRTQDQKLFLQDLSMKLLEGSLKMNGSYQNTTQNQPFFDYGFEIKNVDIPTMARTVSGFRKMIPGAENSTGRLDAKLDLKGRFDEQLKVIPATANGKGSFGTRNLVIVNSPLFRQLGGIIRKDMLQSVDVDNFTASINIENGNIVLQPFETKVMGQPTKVAGTLNAENLLDFRFDFLVKREAIGPDIQKILSVIPGNEKIKVLPAAVNINGPSGHPKVKPDLSVTTKAVADATKDDLKNSLKGILKLFK